MTDPSFPLSEALGHMASDKRLDVLRRVGHTGSISQAARDVGISYKAAWQAIETLTNLSGWSLVDRSVGGSGGGGATLTAQGAQLLALADELAQARAQVLARFAAASLSPLGVEANANAGAALGRTGLRTSMRNQMPCTVTTVQPLGQGTQVRVGLVAACGAQLASHVTQDSADLLGLVPGLEVLVLCKATAVRVSAAPLTAPAVDRNSGPDGLCALHGVVADVSPGPGPQEVSLTLPGGQLWVGFSAQGGQVAQVAASAQGAEGAAPKPLQVGDAAWAVCEPSGLVIGLPG